MILDPISRVAKAIEDIKAGRMVILVDDEDRENEGDFVMAASKVTPEAINFMATYGRGLICLAVDGATVDKLELPMMVRENRASMGTAFTVSIEARHGVSTGISAKDRATTILAAIADDAHPRDLVSPGHVFPLRARDGGVLVRTGQTEGSVDLARLAGEKAAGVICEIMRPDGEMARMPELEEVAATHGLLILSVADLIAYRLRHERIVKRTHQLQLRPSWLGPGSPYDVYIYEASVEPTEYAAFVRGDVHAASARGEDILVRVQTTDLLTDAIGSRRETQAAFAAVEAAGIGVVMLVSRPELVHFKRSAEKLAHPSRGAVATQTAGSEALRDFGLGAQVLADVGCKRIMLLSDVERRIVGIEAFGIELVGRKPLLGAA
ncbi:MAG: 3,4-dihydroxy-2-butanone-4-phosphate synthase [Myxococcales bacterium]|nr:3,4-dihydroxy-2-butanone-4-phosphate synthase [Myxococcales bacterium]